MKRYMKAKKTMYRKQTNEKNDCSVIAISIVARTTYKAAHSACWANGRKFGKGMPNGNILSIVRGLGFSVEPVKKLRQKNGSKFTPKTIGNKLKKGYYLCFCRGHVFAVVNGDVEDWTEGRQHHIYSAYKVTRTRAK